MSEKHILCPNSIKSSPLHCLQVHSLNIDTYYVKNIFKILLSLTLDETKTGVVI